jgi:hypothetical protein
MHGRHGEPGHLNLVGKHEQQVQARSILPATIHSAIYHYASDVSRVTAHFLVIGCTTFASLHPWRHFWRATPARTPGKPIAARARVRHPEIPWYRP